MAFRRGSATAPEAIGAIEVTLFTPGPLSRKSERASVRIEIAYSDGRRRVEEYDLAKHLSSGVIDQLRSFMATVRSKAESEILPEPLDNPDTGGAGEPSA